MLILIKLVLIFTVINIKSVFASEECKTDSNLKIGLMENEYIDYQYYLYYELANFVREKNIEFDLQFVKNNVDDFDIIFGEWDKISKLSLYEISLPSKIKDFYQNNGIKINNNVLPLDLDTFILLSNQNYSLESLEGLSNFYSPIKYTFGMNFNDNNLIKLISFISHQDIEDLNSNTFESAISSFKKLYQNSNKNILNSDLTKYIIHMKVKKICLPCLVMGCSFIKI